MTQKDVREFMIDYPQPMNLQTCLNDIVSEVGELAKEVNIANSWSRYEDHSFRPNFKVELGQVLFTVLQLAEVADIDAEEALNGVIRQFEERYRRQGHTGSSTYLAGDEVSEG